MAFDASTTGKKYPRSNIQYLALAHEKLALKQTTRHGYFAGLLARVIHVNRAGIDLTESTP